MLNFILENENHLLCHLGMTGGWRITKNHVRKSILILKYVIISFYPMLILVGSPYVPFWKKEAQKKLNELGEDLKSKNFTEQYFINSLKNTLKDKSKSLYWINRYLQVRVIISPMKFVRERVYALKEKLKT